MRLFLVALLCVLGTTARAEFGIGGLVGADDASIVFPIRLSSVMLEPYLGYSNGDQTVNSTSSEMQSIGLGIFGLKSSDNDISIYYGARLTDLSVDRSSVVINNQTGLPAGRSFTTTDGYAITPTVGFQYDLGRMAVSAEIGWEYREIDEKIRQVGSFGAVTSSNTNVSRSTRAAIAIRHFF